MITYFLKGGVMMWPLLVSSILSLAVIIERTFYFWWIHRQNRVALPRLRQLLNNGEFAGAQVLCQQYRFPLTEVLEAGLAHREMGRERLKEVVEEVGETLLPELERYLPLLGTIASIATLLGFTGTVTGMIRAFNSIAAQGVSSPAIVASGISEALITTAAGLFIAIPTLIAYHYYAYRAEQEILQISKMAKEFLGI